MVFTQYWKIGKFEIEFIELFEILKIQIKSVKCMVMTFNKKKKFCK